MDLRPEITKIPRGQMEIPDRMEIRTAAILEVMIPENYRKTTGDKIQISLEMVTILVRQKKV